jgi:phosphopantothenoylcysteine decarboxylase/phosphopantothenate--cysteine ligase
MKQLKEKKILIGVSGSIAAYKIAYLVRLLVKQGAEVKVVMTPAAQKFITALTLSTLSKNPVYADVSSEDGWHNHVELGLWADIMIIAPATANTLAKMANGQCDNMLLAAYLSSRCPVYFAPAMDLDMWTHPATQANVDKLLSYGNYLIPVEDGELASGLVGKGRMAEPEEMLRQLHIHFSKHNETVLSGKTILITSGPTQEALDPVRFISNHSSGKMGAAIADQAAWAGAKVIFVSGPAKVLPQNGLVSIVAVKSAEEMYQAAKKYADQADIIVLAAAVADYTPKAVATQKIKKKTNEFQMELRKTHDIAAELGKEKQEHQISIGFALETTNALEHAKKKLVSKNLDLIVLNTLEDSGAGFGHDTNKVTFVERNDRITRYTIKPKEAVAEDIINKLKELVKIK